MKVPPSRHRFRGWLGRILLGGAILLLILGALLAWAGASAKATLAKQVPAPGQLVDVGGYKMHLYCTGQGSPTLLMDAGNNEFSTTWAAVQPELQLLTRVCVYDRAGFGWSESSPFPRTSETMVKELHTLLVNANIKGPYVLVGHSFGGMNMRLYAQRYPAEVVGLVLVDSAHEAQTLRVPALQNAAAPLLDQFRVLALLNSFGLLALSPEDIPSRELPDEALAQYRAILATSRYFETAIAETEALEQSFAEVRAAQITTLGDLPLVVISRGLSDPLPGFSEAEAQQYEEAWQVMQSELVALSTNSRQIIAEQSGHYIQLQQPQRVIEAVKQVVEMATQK